MNGDFLFDVSISIVYSVTTKDNYETIKKVLEFIHYDDHK